MTATGNNGNGSATGGGPKGPIVDRLTKPLAKRFYKDASVTEAEAGRGFAVVLDGRRIKTPAKNPLSLPTRAAANGVAAEWQAQGAEIDPATMPLNRFSNTAIDAVARALPEVAADIVAYANRDLICYRADAPDALVLKQSAAWNPVLGWCETALTAKFRTVAGVMPVEQSPDALGRIAALIAPLDAFRLTSLHVMTTLTGSALLALAHTEGFITADTAWAAAHVDEDYQIALWGDDEEARLRREARAVEFQAASTFYRLNAPEKPTSTSAGA